MLLIENYWRYLTKFIFIKNKNDGRQNHFYFLEKYFLFNMKKIYVLKPGVYILIWFVKPFRIYFFGYD